MAELETQIAHIFIHYYSHKSASTCNLFKSEPTKNQEDQLGRLFGILEINTPSKENSQIITQLINYLEEAYYSQIEHDKIDLEEALEKALKEVNQKFIQLMQERKVYLVGNLNEHTIKEKINFAVGVIKGQELLLSYLNNISIYLVHKTKQDYKIINIKNAAAEETESSNGKISENLFQNLIRGEIQPGDYFFIANSSFLENLSLERIKKTITSLPIHKAAEYFKNSLLQFEGFNFAAIFIKNSTPESNANVYSSSLSSITELNSTELSTENLLTPSFGNKVKSFSSKTAKAIKNIFSNYQNSFDNPEPEKTNQPQILPQTSIYSSFGQPALKRVKPVANNILVILKRPFKYLSSHSNFFIDKYPKIKYYLRVRLLVLGTYLKKIPNLSKILLIIAIFLLILFIYSTSYFKQKQVNQDDLKQYQDLISQIEQKRNDADSNIIFGDEAKAKLEIIEAQNLLATLPVESQRQKDKYQEINKTLQTVISKLRHITIINEPSLIADLTPQDQTTLTLNNLIYQNKILYAFDSNANSAYKIDLGTQTPTKITSNLSDIGKIIKVKLVNNRLLAYHDKNGFVELANDKLNPVPVVLPANAKIADFASYNNRLYTIDLANKQIYRHPQLDPGFDSGVTWLTDPSVDLSAVNSLAIDTNIWLLTSKGEVYKLTKGQKQVFNTTDIEPALENPTQLYSDDETQYIYILEPKNKRIVVIDKEGKLFTQYYSENFDNLTGFSVVEKEKKMFIINGTKIYFFNLEKI